MKEAGIHGKISIVQTKGGQAMEWNKKLQLIIDHVEHNLQAREELIDREEISRIAGCSFDFFKSIFLYEWDGVC